jgi:hypothetical protein
VKPAILAKRITLKGKPIFTEKELTRYLKNKKLQTGGGSDVYDKVFKRIGAALPGSGSGEATGPINIGKCAPGINLGIFGDILDKLFFSMYHLEQIPIIGQLLIAPAFDAVTLGLPAGSEFVEKLITYGAGVLPVPGIVGEMAATIAECVLSFIATCLNISRKQFGSAFKTGLGIIPFAGDILETGAQQFEIGLGRYMQRRDGMIDPVRPYSPTLGKLGNAYLPTLESPTEPAPSLSMDTVNKVKEELQDALQQEAEKNPQVKQALNALQKVQKTVKEALPGVLPKDIMEKLETQDIPGAAFLAVEKAKDLVGSLSNPKALLDKAKNAASSAASSAVTKASGALSSTVEKTVTNMKNKATNGFKPTTIRKKRVNYRRQTRRR